MDLSDVDFFVSSGHLKMGVETPAGVRLDANGRYLTLNNPPWLPVMGEFHFSRYPHNDWKDELLKIKQVRSFDNEPLYEIIVGLA